MYTKPTSPTSCIHKLITNVYCDFISKPTSQTSCIHKQITILYCDFNSKPTSPTSCFHKHITKAHCDSTSKPTSQTSCPYSNLAMQRPSDPAIHAESSKHSSDSELTAHSSHPCKTFRSISRMSFGRHQAIICETFLRFRTHSQQPTAHSRYVGRSVGLSVGRTAGCRSAGIKA